MPEICKWPGCSRDRSAFGGKFCPSHYGSHDPDDPRYKDQTMNKPRRARLDPIDLWLLRHLADESPPDGLITPHPLAWHDLRDAGYVKISPTNFALENGVQDERAKISITITGMERAKP